MTALKYDSPLGPLILVAHEGDLIYCNWMEKECRGKLEATLKASGLKDAALYELLCSGEVKGYSHHSNIKEDECILKECKKQLIDYFEGKRRSFTMPLKFIGTDFQIRVWKAISEIGYGEEITYSALADKCGGIEKSRAVANAAGRNPLAIIVPCHRVLAKKGGIGGYTGGLEKKITLLNIEKRDKTEENIEIMHKNLKK